MLDRLQSPFHGSGQGLESGLRTAVRANKRQSFAEVPNRPSKPGLFVLNVHGLRLCRCRPIGSPYSVLARGGGAEERVGGAAGGGDSDQPALVGGLCILAAAGGIL